MSHSKFQISIHSSLLHRLKTGDMHAYEQLYKLFEIPIYNLALKITRCQDEASDILQETFIKVFKNIQQYEGKAPFWTWVRKIAVNATMQSIRSRQQNANKSNHIFNHAISEHKEHIEPLYRIECRNIADALQQLPVDTRTVVWLFDVEGFSHSEIAQLTQKTVSYSKSQLSRAHQKLRKHLEIKQEALPVCKTVN